MKIHISVSLFGKKVWEMLSRTETLLGPQVRALCLDKNILFISSSYNKDPSFVLPLDHLGMCAGTLAVTA